MKKWIALIVITSTLLLVELFFAQSLNLHSAFQLMVIFFMTQTFVLFRLDRWIPKEWVTQLSMGKIVIRFLSSLVFILILIYSQTDLVNLVVQFIILYLTYMIFEIVEALTTLRRN